MKLLKITTLEDRFGMSRATVHRHIKDRLMTRPIKLGGHTARWPDNEVEAIISARVGGATDEEIRELVVSLEFERIDAQRQSARA